MKSWTVGDVMTREVVSAGQETDYRALVRALAANGVSAVPVVDEAGRVLGVVSEADLLHKVEFLGDTEPPKIFTGRSKRQARVKSTADRAGDLMTAPAVTVRPDTALAEAARLLDAHNIKRLPVVDEGGRLVGILSRVDLLRIYTRPDDQILEEIQQGVLRKTLWIDPKQIDIQVAAGVVRLRGQVDRRSTAMLVAHLSGAVAGVSEVQDELSWEFDDSKLDDPAYFRSHPFSAPQ
jgi:CBS domain-containing protein